MNQASEAPGHIITQASAWDFSDPVVLLGVFTVVFAVGMAIWIFRWVQKNIAIDASNAKE